MELVTSPVAVSTNDVEASLHNDVTKELDKQESVEDFIKSKPVFMVSKSTCPFCFELKRTLQSYGVNYEVVEIDKLPAMASIQKDLKEKYGQSTVPLLFLKGELVGGCMHVKELEHSGEFQRVISPFLSMDVPIEDRVSRFTFLYFPETVNKLVVRAVGLLSMIYCILCVAFFKRRGTRYAVLGLAIDFFLRVIFGSGSSPIGMVGAALMAPFPPVFSAGPPKQFAACCGTFMSALAAALLLSGQELGGTIVIGMLIMPTGLEGVFDFCLGCWMFGIAISLNIIPPSIYRPYLNHFPAKKWAQAFSTDTTVQYEAVPSTHVMLPGQTKECPVDLIRKDRFETEAKLQDMHAKNVTVDFFALPMTGAALAVVFKATAEMERDGISAWDTKGAYHGLALISAFFFGLLALVQLYKLVCFPKKICKEWNHPIFGNFYTTITICVTSYGILLYDSSSTAGVVLVWVAAVVQMVWTVLRLADLLYGRIGADMITPAVVFTPLGNLISGYAFASFPTYKEAATHGVNYIFVARLWFSVGIILGAVLFVVSLQKAMLDHHSDQRLRPLLWVWMAAFAMAGPTYLAVTEAGDQAGASSSVFYQCMFLFSLFLFAVNAVGYLRGFFTYVADMSIWIVPFSCAVLALSSVQYYAIVDGEFAMLLAIILIVIACTSASVCFGYTLMWTLDCSLFRPRVKWGPVSFMKLTHEVFRHAFPKLQLQLDSLEGAQRGGQLNAVAVSRFVQDMEAMFLTYSEHGRHEELVLFPTLRRYHPGLNPSMDEEHEHEHALLASMQTALKTFNDGEKNPAAMLQLLQELKSTFPEFSAHVLDHLRNEERTITVVARKYLTVAMQRDVNRRVWELTPIESWYVTVPYILQNLPHPQWKTRFLRTFIWAEPDSAQQIGLMCYRSLNSVEWELLAQEIPEIVPRGVRGWVRQY